MWELAVITLVVLLLVLIFLIVVCWISSNNCCRKNKRHISLLETRVETGLSSLQSNLTVASTKAFLTLGARETVDRLSGTVKLVNWEAQPLNYFPEDGWTPVFSTVDKALIGSTVPLSGTYFVHYQTSIITNVAAALMIVNGQPLTRSLSQSASPSVNTTTAGGPTLLQLQKSYLVNLSKDDIVSIIILNLSGPGFNPPGEYLHSLTLDLRDAHQPSAPNSVDVAPDAHSPQESVTNLEQWLNADRIAQIMTDASSCANAASNQSDQLNCIQSALASIANPPIESK